MSDPELLDPSLSVSDSLKPNAQLIPDPTNTYTRIVWLNGEAEKVSRFLSQSIAQTILDHEGVWRKRDSNKRAYEALSNEGEAITLPMCRSNTNQQHAWLVDTLWSKDPPFDCDALGDRTYTIVIQNPDTKVYEEKKVTATDQARGIRYLLNYKWEHRLPMRRVLNDWSMEALQDGNLPSLVKVVHDDRYYSRNIKEYAPPTTQRSEDGSSSYQIINSTRYRQYQGETVRVVTVPGENFLKPFSSLTIDESPWVAQVCEEPLYESHRKLSIGSRHEYGGYDFCLPDDETPTEDQRASVLYGGEIADDQPNKRASRSAKEVNKQRELNPLSTNIIYETYFRWPILTEEEAAKPSPTIEWVELCGDFHLKSKQLLCCWELGNWNGERPFVDFFMRPRPNSYSGTCTVEDIAPFQRYASQLFHLQVQNMVMRNVSVFFVRKGSSAATSLRGRKLRPGMIVEFDDPTDVESKPLGTPIDSVSSEIQFLRAGAQEMSLITQYDTGTAELSRVTSGAFSQQQDLAKMQPQQIYDNWSDAISRLALKYIQTLIQYAPEQELPKFDDVSDAVIDNVLHLPREMVASGEFSIYPTATPRDETKQAESQRDVQLSMAIDKANHFLIEMWGLIAKPGVPPPFVIVGLRAIQRTEKILGELISHTRHDASEYVIKQEELMSLIHKLYDMQQQLEQQQQEQQAAAGAPAGAPAGAGAAPPGGPPIKIALKADLTPEQEIAAAQAAGIAGQQAAAQQQPPPQPPPQGVPLPQPQPPPPPPPLLPPQGVPNAPSH